MRNSKQPASNRSRSRRRFCAQRCLQVDLAEYLRASRRILVFTGAGISTGSGIADFRGPQGVWTRRQPVYYEDFMTSEAARIEHWDYKLEAWESFRKAQPNDVHRAIVRLEQAEKLRMVVTQNIDGLHSLAGTSRERLVELHGTNSLVECQSCKRRSDPEPHFDFFRAQRTPPLCACGGFLKPATISFGQSLEPHELERARPRPRWKRIWSSRSVPPCRFTLRLRFLCWRRSAEFPTSSSIEARRSTTASRAFRFGSRVK